jgi:biopolymer transport protein ExbD
MPKKNHGRFKKKKEEGGLIITSLIDVFTILTVFLLKNYSSEGNIAANAENLVLPNSSSTKKLQEGNLQVAVSPDMVLVDNKAVVPTPEVANIPQTVGNPVVPKLEERLKACFAQEEEMVRLGAQNRVEGKVILQMDKNISFDVMYKIMFTCGAVGYKTMRFAVMQREEG